MEHLQYFTVNEFAGLLKVKRQQVYKWIAFGRIKAIRLNETEKSPWRIPFTELQRMHASAYRFAEEEDEEENG